MQSNGIRKDGENLVKVIQDKGYDFVETKDALLNSKSNKIWGSFSHHALAFDMDRIATNPGTTNTFSNDRKSNSNIIKR